MGVVGVEVVTLLEEVPKARYVVVVVLNILTLTRGIYLERMTPCLE